MAKKSNKQQQPATSRPAPARPVVKSPKIVEQKKEPSALRNHLFIVAGILLATFAALYPSLSNQFTNWDDPGYVINEQIFKNLSAVSYHDILTKSIMGNYHPLTMLTYAWDYSAGNLEPYHYHLQSLLFHLGTVLLVYCFVQLLTGRMLAAAITALLFGIHPMHVESVAWVSGRKDVVYGFFYMGACIAYLYYHRTLGSKKWLWYAGIVVLFLCSLLSKPVAVILPVTLLVIDLFEGRLFRWNSAPVNFSETGAVAQPKVNYLSVFVEKVPFFLMSVGFGIRSIQDQNQFGALGTQGEHFNAIERIALGGYALVTYLWKAVVPVKLLCFYPYPLQEKGSLPAVYYIYPLIAAVVLVAIFWFARKNKGIIFGMLFFLTNIVLLLQFIPVGGAIIADRYSYIPYLGLIFMLAWAVSSLFQEKGNKQIGRIAVAGVAVYALFIGVLSNDRCRVWYDALSLWRDEIEVEPVRAPNAYNNLGFQYYHKFNESPNPAERKIYYDSAAMLLNRAIQLQPDFVNPYISLGELQRSNGEYPAAKINYYTGLKKSKENEQSANAYMGLAITYSILYSQTHLQSDKDSAKYCFIKIFELKPFNPEAHSNYANYLDMTDEKQAAIVEYGKAIEQNPDIYSPYLNRARALQRMKNYSEALKDFARSIDRKPDLGEIYFYRSQCYVDMNNLPAALADADKAKSLGFVQFPNGYYEYLKSKGGGR